MKIASGLLAYFVTMPIFFYLTYQVLVRVEASELMWFLYWIYVPVGILAVIMKTVADNGELK